MKRYFSATNALITIFGVLAIFKLAEFLGMPILFNYPVAVLTGMAIGNRFPIFPKSER